ncbi:hypothetical protein [Tenacibaculum sp.]|uniref:hypothetical protein n=1 Tax=Tenacibaculum sp. TaxID=1906242 RepID=UPI003AA8743F
MRTENMLLILGLIFSVFLLTFRIENGIEFLNVQLKFSIIDVALNTSMETYLNSAILGYLCYLIFIFVVWNKTNKNGKTLLMVYSILTLIGIGIELNLFYEGFNGTYSGKHFRIGIPLAIIGFYIVNRMNKTKLKNA